MENQTQQKTVIKWFQTLWSIIWIGWVVWVVIGSVSAIFFLNPSRYWIYEIIFKWWSDIGSVLLGITIIFGLLSYIADRLITLHRKRKMLIPEKPQKELPKMKNGETVLDYFHRTQSLDE